jgi:restriction system protein
MLFYMESQLEDFLIENWDNTELGQQYDLIKDENNELVSQQFATDIGRIDILAREKSSGRYVVIELKKNQTSDDTIGQLARYMGWVDEHVSEGSRSRGIIIAASFDKKLHYASKRISDVEVYEYRVGFHLLPSES